MAAQLSFAIMKAPATAPTLLDKIAVQQMLNISGRSLEKLVRARRFPPPLRLGKTVRWSQSVVVQWLNEQLTPQLEWKPPRAAQRPPAAD